MRRDTPKSRAFVDRARRRSAESLRESSRRSQRQAAEDRRQKPRVPFSPYYEKCWLAKHDPERECEGIVLRCHLIKEQTLLALGFDLAEAWHEDFWVPGCQGFGPGIGGHHFRLDQGLLSIDRRDVPARLERRALHDQRIAAQLDRLFGELPKIGAAA